MNAPPKLKPFAALVRKDLKVFLSDRRSVIVSFVVPLALASLLSMIGGGGGGGRSKIPVAVVDLDGSKLSAEVVAGLTHDEGVKAEVCADADDARAKVRQGALDVAVVIPKGFGAAAAKGLFGSGEKPVLTFLTDPTESAAAGMVRGILMESAMKAVTRDAFSGTGGVAALDDAEAVSAYPTATSANPAQLPVNRT